MEECRTLAVQAVESGRAFEKLKEIVSAQGGDVSYLDDTSKLERSRYCFEVLSECEGYISSINCEAVGHVSNMLGAGRQKKEDTIDHSAGIELCKKTGSHVNKGEVLARLYTNNKEKLEASQEKYLSAIVFSDKQPECEPLIYKILN